MSRGSASSTRSSRLAARVARTVERIPPPAAAISWYQAPRARSAYSSSREPAKIAWVWESTKPGSPTAPRPSMRCAPGTAPTSAASRDSGPTHTIRPPAAAIAPRVITPSGPSPSAGAHVTSSARFVTMRSAVLIGPRTRSCRDARQVEAVAPGRGDRVVIACVGMAHDAGARIGRQHARETEPADQVRVVAEGPDQRGVGLIDVLGIARERDPAERPLPLAEERADEGGHEAGIGEVGDAGVLGRLPDVVAVVEENRAALLELEHRAHLLGERGMRAREVLLGIARAEPRRRLHRKARGDVAVQHVVGRGLVRHDVEPDPTP